MSICVSLCVYSGKGCGSVMLAMPTNSGQYWPDHVKLLHSMDRATHSSTNESLRHLIGSPGRSFGLYLRHEIQYNTVKYVEILVPRETFLTFALSVLRVLTTHSYAGAETKLIICLAVDRIKESNTGPCESAMLVSTV
jgi:hypothetical protein